MDGELLARPSDRTYTDVFIESFPQYMAMGMSYQEYWQGPPWLAKSYRDAFEIKQEHKNWELWMGGAYFYEALRDVAPVMRASFSKKPVEFGKYPEKPWPITEKAARQEQEAKERAAFERMLARFNAESKKNTEESVCREVS